MAMKATPPDTRRTQAPDVAGAAALAGAGLAACAIAMIALDQALAASALALALEGSICGPLTHGQGDGPRAGEFVMAAHCAACHVAATGFAAGLGLAAAAFRRLGAPVPGVPRRLARPA